VTVAAGASATSGPLSVKVTLDVVSGSGPLRSSVGAMLAMAISFGAAGSFARPSHKGAGNTSQIGVICLCGKAPVTFGVQRLPCRAKPG
jgi:hypothetical protein